MKPSCVGTQKIIEQLHCCKYYNLQTGSNTEKGKAVCQKSHCATKIYKLATVRQKSVMLHLFIEQLKITRLILNFRVTRHVTPVCHSLPVQIIRTIATNSIYPTIDNSCGKDTPTLQHWRTHFPLVAFWTVDFYILHVRLSIITT